MSRILGDSAVAVAQTTSRWNRIAAPMNNIRRSYCLRPPVPQEKKWLYKQVLESVQSGIAPQFNLSSSTLGRATSQMWVQLNILHRRAQDVAEDYQLKEKLGTVIQQLAGCVAAVKDFVVLKRYYQLDRIIDKSLLALEEKIRATREADLMPVESPPGQLRSTASCAEVGKVSTKNCTMIMLQRDAFPRNVHDVKTKELRQLSPIPAVTIDRSQRSPN